MSRAQIFTSIMLLIGVGLLSATANALDEKVNCDRGDSLQAALNRHANNPLPVAIYVSGTCHEEVTVPFGPVRIFGEDGAVIDGQIYVNAGNTLFLFHIKLTGPAGGVVAERGTVYLRRVNASQNQFHGVVANYGSLVESRNSVISENGELGVYVANGSTFVSNGDQITSNGSHGIGIDNNANVVTNGSTISGNAGSGMHANLHSSVVNSDSTISGNGTVGILISEDSGVVTRSNVTITGNSLASVYCLDEESSFQNEDAGSAIDPPISCTGF